MGKTLLHSKYVILVLLTSAYGGCAGSGLPNNDNHGNDNDNSSVLDNGNVNGDENVNDNLNENGGSTENQNQNAGDNDESPEPPAEALLDAGLDLLVESNDLVALQATIDGPAPVSIVWTSDPANPIEPIGFVDQGDGLATFIAPTLLNVTFDLIFTVTATYNNSSSLSDNVTITVSGGPG